MKFILLSLFNKLKLNFEPPKSKIPGWYDGSTHALGMRLAPGFDMFNHDKTPNCHWMTEATTPTDYG